MLDYIIGLFKDRQSSAILLLSCAILFIFILPAFQLSSTSFSIILFSVILFIAAASISAKVLVIGMIAILTELSTRATDFVYLHYFAELITNLFILFIVCSVIRDLMKETTITIYSLVDALNGYLLLGMLFASLVAFCELHIPGSFPMAKDTDMELMYYTFITLTTAGYGDVTPNLPLAQSLSMLIAITGQFYVAIVVAIIVGKYANVISNKEKS
ncbi:MAG: ion channel [Eudoraea sp.]